MTEQIPDDVGEAIDLEITYESDDFGIKIAAELGDTSFIIEHAWGEEGATQAATLLQAAPQILMRVHDALNSQEEA